MRILLARLREFASSMLHGPAAAARTLLWASTGVSLLVLLLARMDVVTRNKSFELLGASYFGLCQQWRLHQLVTSCLVHHGLLDLAFNMLGLYWLGQLVEAQLGSARFWFVCLWCNAATAALYVVLVSNGTLLGAVPILYGLLAALACTSPDLSMGILGFRVTARRAIFVIPALQILWVGLSDGGDLRSLVALFGAPVAWCYLNLGQYRSSVASRWTEAQAAATEARRRQEAAAVQAAEAERQGAEESCLRVARALRRRNFGEARKLLDAARLPRKRRPVLDELRAMIGYLESVDDLDGMDGEKLLNLSTHILRLWNSAIQTELHGVLPEVVEMTEEWGTDDLTEQIVTVLAGSPGTTRTPPATDIRNALTRSLTEQGDRAFQIVAGRLSAASLNEASGSWLLALLPDLEPRRRGSTLVALYARLVPKARTNLVSWLAKLLGPSSDVLIELLAGSLERLPPDRSFPIALQEKVGTQNLERECIHWAARNNYAAQKVLKRLYDYG